MATITQVPADSLANIRKLNDNGYEVNLAKTGEMWVVTAYERDAMDKSYTESDKDIDVAFSKLFEKIGGVK